MIRRIASKINFFSKDIFKAGFFNFLRNQPKTRRIIVICSAIFIVFHMWLHFTNPYAKINVFEKPYYTFVNQNGDIEFRQKYKMEVYTNPVADLLGYYKSGFLILQNTLFGGGPARGKTPDEVINSIHDKRFDADKPYLISGDQFSVLYPRNLGVFYNQILNPNTALDQNDWQDRQKLYLQSVLFAIDGLSASNSPKTTIVPIGQRQVVLTQVHPGGVGSDQVYGVFFAIHKMQTAASSNNHKYRIQTIDSANFLAYTRQSQLQKMFDNYIDAVYDTSTKRVKDNLHLSSARDGVIRRSSFYDNIILYETAQLARQLGLQDKYNIANSENKQMLKNFYWNESAGFYNDDIKTKSFSSDFLIGYVNNFFDLNDLTDLSRTKRTIDYLNDSELVRLFPIKYQIDGNPNVPKFVDYFVANYGRNVIWSYWGSQYITLLSDMHKKTGDSKYKNEALKYLGIYEQNLIRDQGLAETYSPDGRFLRTGIYKSIRSTGWVVQLEHAKYSLEH